MICAMAIDPAHDPILAFNVLDVILSNDQDSDPMATELLQIVKSWRNNTDEDTKLVTRATTSSIVARVRRRDDPWFILASNELGVPGSVLREYTAHGDNLSFAILIHITRQQFSHFEEEYWPSDAFLNVLKVASDINVQDTSSPELQHAFCTLWNRIVLRAQNENDRRMTFLTLRPIRNVYAALHQDTGSAPTRFSASTDDSDRILFNPSSYPVCNVVGHIHGTVLRDSAALPPASLSNPDVHFSFVPPPPRVVESLTEVSLLDGFLSVHQTTTERSRIPITSPDPTTAGAIRSIVTSAVTVPHDTPDTSTRTLPLSSTSPPAAVALQYNPDLLTPSDPPNLPVSASSDPVLDNIVPTGLPLPHSLTTRPDLSSSFPKPHRAIIVTIPSTSPGPSSALDLCITAGDDGDRRDKVVGPPSVNRTTHANAMTTLDLPPAYIPVGILDITILVLINNIFSFCVSYHVVQMCRFVLTSGAWSREPCQR
ncbi:hypothetical protein EDB83DRAFT_2415254 [Lactarius deliciosus]|nr:hypothetical protein EDB83DRAFT_2415254 [Lactarius deliciosus]